MAAVLNIPHTSLSGTTFALYLRREEFLGEHTSHVVSFLPKHTAYIIFALVL